MKKSTLAVSTEQERTERRIEREQNYRLRRSQIPEDKTWLTPGDVGALSDYCEGAIRKFIRQKEIQAKEVGKVGSRHHRFRIHREWMREWQQATIAKQEAKTAEKQAKDNLPWKSYESSLTYVLWMTWTTEARSNEKFSSWCEDIYRHLRIHLAKQNTGMADGQTLTSMVVLEPYYPDFPVYGSKTQQAI